MSSGMLSYLTNYLFPFAPYGGLTFNLFTELERNQSEKEFNQLINTTFGGKPMNLLNSITFNCSQMIDFCNFGFNKIYDGSQCCDLFFRPAEFGLAFMCLRTNKDFEYFIEEAGIRTGVLIGRVAPLQLHSNGSKCTAIFVNHRVPDHG